MFDVVDGFIDSIKKVIKAVNELNKAKKANHLKSIPKRIDLLLIGMSLIEKAENSLLEYKEMNREFDINKVIKTDYLISEYANKFYVVAVYIMDILTKNHRDKSLGQVFSQNREMFIELTNKMMHIAARWDIERMINVFEFDVPVKNRAFPRRKPLLDTCIFFANRMNATKLGIEFEDKIMPKKIIFSVQPNAGKSFVLNVYCLMSTVLHAIYYNTSGILRMSNNISNSCGFSNQIKSMIENDKIAKIYPELLKYFKDGKSRILEKSTSEEWKVNDVDPRIRASYFARGRDSAINSIRVFVLLAIDDLSDGFDQMNSDEAHKDMTTKYEIDMDSRKEESNVPEFIVGTMFNEYDIPNTIIAKLEKNKMLVVNKHFRNVRNTEDYSIVIITVDCFNEKGESAAPNLISTQRLIEKQESLKSYEFDLVYRQIRSSREPRLFDYKNLRTYDRLPENLSFTATAVLDPTRKNGNDYFSLPVFREQNETGLYYLVNCIYEQKSLGTVSDPQNRFLEKVVNFIIENKITKLIIENNTSNTIGTVLDLKMKEKGFHFCNIIEKYTSKIKGKESKMQRILSQEATITRNIVFPSPGMFSPKHQITEFMNHFTKYDVKENYNKRGMHDDACDSVSMFAQYNLFNRLNRFSELKLIDRSSIFG